MNSHLWEFLAQWRELFNRFDEDGSGNISYDEFSKALIGMIFQIGKAAALRRYSLINIWSNNDMVMQHSATA